MNGVLAIVLLAVAAVAYTAGSQAQEVNVTCKPDYVLIDGEFEKSLEVENIYISYDGERILQVDVPFPCELGGAFLTYEDENLKMWCKTRRFLTSVTINRKTGKYKRFTQSVASTPFRYEDVVGKCYRKGDLF